MKKNLLIVLTALAATACSCKKSNLIEGGTLSREPSITITSPIGKESYHSGEYITVTWKSANLPQGSVILATITNHLSKTTGSGLMGVWMLPQKRITISLNSTSVTATDNTGSAVFQIPDEYNNLYYQSGTAYNYGNNFTLSLAVAYPVNGVWQTTVNGKFVQSESPDFFTVWRDGCNSLTGFSYTTGQSCSVPH